MEPITCPGCGHRIEEAGVQFCPACGVSLGGDAPPAASRENSIPFEDTAQPFFQRFFQTAGKAFANPLELFSGVSRAGVGLPLLYGVIVGTAASVFGLLWNMMFGGMAMLFEDLHADEFAITTGVYLGLMVLSPLFATLGLFVGSAIYHVSLLILGSGERGFAVTFRALAYGGTPNLLAVVPFCGGLVGGIWAMVVTIIAARQGHGTDWWRAILGYFLLPIVCCCLGAGLAMMLGLLGVFSD